MIFWYKPPPCKLWIGLSEDGMYDDLSSRSPIHSLQGGGLYQNIIISLHRKSQGLSIIINIFYAVISYDGF